MTFKPTKPVKVKPVKQAEPKSPAPWIAFALGVFFLLGGVAFVTAWTAIRVVDTTVQLGAQAVSASLQFVGAMAENAALVLESGEDEQRIELLNQISEVDFANSQIPDFFVQAVEKNLDHENESVRKAAAAALNAINVGTVVATKRE